MLGRYGPNHAGDPVVTRWKRTDAGEIYKIDNKPVLQFVAIYRADTNEWAIPGVSGFDKFIIEKYIQDRGLRRQLLAYIS